MLSAYRHVLVQNPQQHLEHQAALNYNRYRIPVNLMTVMATYKLLKSEFTWYWRKVTLFMIVLFLLALPARYRDVDMRNFFTSFNQTVLAFNIITVKASISPVFCTCSCFLHHHHHRSHHENRHLTCFLLHQRRWDPGSDCSLLARSVLGCHPLGIVVKMMMRKGLWWWQQGSTNCPILPSRMVEHGVSWENMENTKTWKRRKISTRRLKTLYLSWR